MVAGVGVGQFDALDVLHDQVDDAVSFLRGGHDHYRDALASGFDGSQGPALAHQHVHGAVVLAVGDDGLEDAEGWHETLHWLESNLVLSAELDRDQAKNYFKIGVSAPRWAIRRRRLFAGMEDPLS